MVLFVTTQRKHTCAIIFKKLVKLQLKLSRMDFSSSSLKWDVSFLQAARNWKVDVFASFYILLYSFRGRRVGEDKLWWAPSRKGKFAVHSFYKILACKDAVSFLWKSIWQTKGLLKVAFFAWLASHEKILTLDNLRKRQVIVVNRCCLCKRNGESVDHILIHCEIA
jgi:hypothetical protein